MFTFDADKFLDGAEANLPGIDMVAKLTGLPLALSLAALLRRVLENPDTKSMVADWMRWTPLFTGMDGSNPEPALPSQFLDLRDQMREVRLACQSCTED